MKTTILLFVAFVLLQTATTASSNNETSKKEDLQGNSVNVVCTQDLYPLTAKWANEYNSLNPIEKVNVIQSGKNSVGSANGDYLSFSSTVPADQVGKEPVWKMAVGRQVVVPVMNAANPFSKEVLKTGITQEKLSLMLKNSNKRNWGTVLSNSETQDVHLYIVKEEAVTNALGKFLKGTQVQSDGITYASQAEVVAAVQKDPLAIGICTASGIQGDDNQLLAGNLQFLPIDKNANGTIDYMEAIYADMNTFQRGVWIGKYPKTLVTDIFASSSTIPAKENEVAFLKWVLTDGQQLIASAGYCELGGSESQAQFDKLTTTTINVSPEKDASQTGTALIIVACVIACGLIITFAVRNYRKQQTVTLDFSAPPAGFTNDSMVLPKGLYFDKSHTWSFMEKDGNITVGIDDFLQHITGTITRIEMRNPGDQIKKGDILFSVIQFGKQLNIYAPFSGMIRKQNKVLLTDASTLNSSPYEQGLVYTIEPSNWIKDVQLMDLSDKYRRWLDAEFSRLKDFLGAILRPESAQLAHIVLQDGGELKEGLLSDFGPEVWEDFQSNFLDTFK